MKKALVIIISIIILINFPISIEKAISINKNNDTTNLPSYFCYRNINGKDYTTPIKNQAPAPTCEAYALVAALETIMQYQTGEIFTPDLSEAHLYFYAGGTYESGYVNLIDAANYLKEIGVPDEGCYPDPHRPYDYPFISLDGWENRTVKIKEWGWVENTQESIKNALIKHGPLVFCAHFWKDFLYYKDGVYRHKWGQIAGGHVMTIVGYDDNEQCWIVKNSAGTGWGEEGWLKMSYDAGMITDTWYQRYDENCTGIMYINGSYGNLKPDVPKVQIQTPKFFKTYIFGKEISTIFRKSRLFKKAAPRIIGNIKINVTAENAEKVEFFIDGVRTYIDYEQPYTWDLETIRGRHTLTVKAKNEHNTSMDIIDFYKIIQY
jgi:hypothetical protein